MSYLIVKANIVLLPLVVLGTLQSKKRETFSLAIQTEW
jgi:hypothetical protein